MLVEKLSWPEYQELERDLIMLTHDQTDKARIERILELIGKALLKQSTEVTEL